MTEPCGQCGHPIADEEIATVYQPSGGSSYRVHRRCAALLPVAEARNPQELPWKWTRQGIESPVAAAPPQDDLARRLGWMADAVLHAKVGPKARFFTQKAVDEIVLLLREAEKRIMEGR